MKSPFPPGSSPSLQTDRPRPLLPQASLPVLQRPLSDAPCHFPTPLPRAQRALPSEPGMGGRLGTGSCEEGSGVTTRMSIRPRVPLTQPSGYSRSGLEEAGAGATGGGPTSYQDGFRLELCVAAQEPLATQLWAGHHEEPVLGSRAMQMTTERPQRAGAQPEMMGNHRGMASYPPGRRSTLGPRAAGLAPSAASLCFVAVMAGSS